MTKKRARGRAAAGWGAANVSTPWTVATYTYRGRRFLSRAFPLPAGSMTGARRHTIERGARPGRPIVGRRRITHGVARSKRTISRMIARGDLPATRAVSLPDKPLTVRALSNWTSGADQSPAGHSRLDQIASTRWRSKAIPARRNFSTALPGCLPWLPTSSRRAPRRLVEPGRNRPVYW